MLHLPFFSRADPSATMRKAKHPSRQGPLGRRVSNRHGRPDCFSLPPKLTHQRDQLIPIEFRLESPAHRGSLAKSNKFRPGQFRKMDIYGQPCRAYRDRRWH
jgi:hypothetical protein